MCQPKASVSNASSDTTMTYGSWTSLSYRAADVRHTSFSPCCNLFPREPRLPAARGWLGRAACANSVYSGFEFNTVITVLVAIEVECQAVKLFRSCLKRYMSRINVRLFSEGLQFAIHAKLCGIRFCWS
jgi:hypothetical protein